MQLLHLTIWKAEIMIHQPLGGAKGQASDVKIQAELLLKTRDKLNKILAENTGKPIEQIEKDTDRGPAEPYEKPTVLSEGYWPEAW